MYIKTSAFAHADYFDTLTNFEFDGHKHTKKPSPSIARSQIVF